MRQEPVSKAPPLDLPLLVAVWICMELQIRILLDP